MSLLAWFPLINDTLDYSGNMNHSYASGSVVPSSQGKLGGCYSFNGSGCLVVNETTLNKYKYNSISVCAWIYVDSGTTQNSDFGGYIVNNTSDLSIGNSVFTMAMTTTGQISWGWNGAYQNMTTPGAYNDGIWHFLVGIWDGSQSFLYIDNSLVMYTGVTTNKIVSNSNIGIGGNPNTTTYRSFIGKINDVRIYDNPISIKQINDLYNCNILNYSFNDPIQPIDNLARNKTYTIYNNFGMVRVPSTLIKLSEKYQGCDIYRLSMTLVDSTVLSSFRNDLGSHGVYGFSRTFLANTKYSFSILFRPVTHTDIVVGGTASNIGGWTSFGQRYYKDDWMITGQYRDGSVSTGKTDNIFTSFRSPSVLSGDTVSIDFCCPRLIEGIDYLVDYIDYDKEFDDVIRDSSGFNNHSQPLSFTNSPRWVSSGKTGSGCYSFNGINQYILIGVKDSLKIKPQLSISLWIYPVEYKNAVPICRDDESFSLKWRASGNPWWRLEDISGIQYDFSLNIIPPINEWSHLVFTYDGSVGKCYVNGVLTNTKLSIINLSTTGSLKIGSWTNTSEFFNGFIDDVRIFSTSLNIEDVLVLNKVKASIDNVGGFYSSEFNEKPNMFDQINNQIKLKTFGNGLYSYVQSNCQVSLTDDGYRIYRPANLIYPGAGNTMWGGLRLRPFELDNFYLFKNRKYKVSFKVKGKSSNDPGQIYFTNQMGWGGGSYGLGSVSAYDFNTLGTNFEGEKEIYACFNITDEVFKYCTTSYSNFVTGETYNCYLDLSWGFNYTSTGELGTDLYLSDFKFIDITDDLNKTSVSEKGVVNTIEYSEVGPYEDLIAWIPLDSTPNDISLNAVKGTVFGSPEISSGVLSNSYLFDGVDDYINTNLKCNNILNDNENFSLTAWVYILSNPTVGAQIISCSAYNSEVEGGGFGIGINTAGGVVFKLGDLDTSSEIPFNSTVFNKDVWHFVTLTFDGNNLNCYKNGSLLSKTPRTIWNSNNYNILIGKGTQGGWGGYFNGKISDVRIYSKSLSLEEINILYEISGGNNMVKTKILSDKIYVKNEIKEI